MIISVVKDVMGHVICIRGAVFMGYVICIRDAVFFSRRRNGYKYSWLRLGLAAQSWLMLYTPPQDGDQH